MAESYLGKGLIGLIFVFTATMLGSFAGYFVRLVLARSITPTEIGLFYSAFTIVSFVLLFVNIGTNPALTKHIAEFKAKKKLSELWFSVKFVSTIKVVLGIIASVALWFSSEWLSVVYFKNPAAVSVMQVLSIALLFIVLVGLLGAIFQGFQSMRSLALILFSENFFFLILLFILVGLGFTKNHLLPSYAFLIGWGITLLLFIPCVFRYKKYFGKQVLKKFEKKKLVKKLSFFAFASFFISLGNLVIGYIDTAILTYFKPLSEVGIYNVVLPTVIIIGFFSRSISQVFFPMVSELWAKNLKKKLVEGVNLLHKYALITIIPLAMILFLFPEMILNVLFGAEYVSGALAMRILSVGIIFFTVGMIDQSVLSGIGKPKIVTNILLFAAAFNVITNIIFIPIWGINAAAMTTTLSYILIALLTSVYLRKYIKARSHIAVWIESLFVALVFVMVVYILKNVLALNPYLEALICLVAAGIVYLFACYIMKMINFAELKGFIMTILKKKTANT